MGSCSNTLVSNTNNLVGPVALNLSALTPVLVLGRGCRLDALGWGLALGAAAVFLPWVFVLTLLVGLETPASPCKPRPEAWFRSSLASWERLARGDVASELEAPSLDLWRAGASKASGTRRAARLVGAGGSGMDSRSEGGIKKAAGTISASGLSLGSYTLYKLRTLMHKKIIMHEPCECPLLGYPMPKAAEILGGSQFFESFDRFEHFFNVARHFKATPLLL